MLVCKNHISFHCLFLFGLISLAAITSPAQTVVENTEVSPKTEETEDLKKTEVGKTTQN